MARAGIVLRRVCGDDVDVHECGCGTAMLPLFSLTLKVTMRDAESLYRQPMESDTPVMGTWYAPLPNVSDMGLPPPVRRQAAAPWIERIHASKRPSRPRRIARAECAVRDPDTSEIA